MIIRHVRPELNLSRNTAIIGSSSSLRKAEHGHIIDSYVDVIRFNRAPTKLYEKHVGTKTTLRVVNNHVFDNMDASVNGFTGQPQYFVRDLRDSKLLYVAHDLAPLAKKKENCHKSNEVYKFKWEYVDELKVEYLYPSKFHMALGLIVVLLCVKSGIKPHLFGFDTDQKDRSHYWEARPNGSPCHDIGAEGQIIGKLIREDLVRYFK